MLQCFIVDAAIPGDCRIVSKEEEKVEKYQELHQEMIRMWKLRKVEVVPIVVGALGAVTKNFERWLKMLDKSLTETSAEDMQHCCGCTARILRRHLNAKN